MIVSSVPIWGSGLDREQARRISRNWGLEIRDPEPADRFFLEFKEECLQLGYRMNNRTVMVRVDFTQGPMRYRLQFARGREAIGRAAGIKKGFRPDIVDATAGLGRDAFILAALGCRVHLIERSVVIAALLEDGLRRACVDPRIGTWAAERLSLSCGDITRGNTCFPFVPDAVYLDPMFPVRQKSSLVKKEMKVLQDLLGQEMDADRLLSPALRIARKRVFVKRPAEAGHLDGKSPDSIILTARNRFDIYLVSR